MPTPIARRLALAILATLTLGVATAHAADEAADALKALAGTWNSPPDSALESTWTFEGETLKTTVNGADYVSKVTVDPKAKPATIDLKIKEGPGDTAGETSKGIYKLEGDLLTICITGPGQGARPADFKEEEGVYVFKVKKAAKK